MVKIDVQTLDIRFPAGHALKNVTVQVMANEIISIIGPSNSGKTTFLRMINRLNDLHDGMKITGRVLLDGKDVMTFDPQTLRKKVGMVFAMPSPLPLSIYDNVAYGARMHEMHQEKGAMDAVVERSLKEAHLWEEVKDRLQTSAFKLSGGQQQRLCIARTLAVEPEVILFDEPCSGLDPISTARVEETMLKLKQTYTIVLVTNNVKQAARVGDRTAFFLLGELIEVDKTEKIFTTPSDQRTDDYIRGKFG
jgi:phosphate transport system ATP-binding protein